MAKPMEREKPGQNGVALDKASVEENLSKEIRRELIAEAAYYRGEKRGFQNGDPIEDWLAAEEEIDEKLSEPAPSVIVLGLENSW